MPTSDTWPTNYSQHMVVAGVGTANAGDGIDFIIGQTKLMIQSNDVQYAGTAHGMTVGKWYHLAYVRSGGSINFFVDGQAKGSAAFTGSVGVGGTTYIGSETGQGAYLNGYISNLRAVKNSALYSSNFTPTTTPSSAVSGTSLLTCQDNRFKDNSTNNFTLSASGAPKAIPASPFAPTSTTYSPEMQGGSAYMPGVGNYLVAPKSSIAFGTGDFVIDFWVNIPKRSNGYDNHILSSQKTYYNYLLVGITNSTGVIDAWLGHSAPGWVHLTSAANIIQYNAFNHIVIARTSGVASVFVNGNRVASGALTTDFSLTDIDGLNLGYYPPVGHYMEGYLSNLRIVKGAVTGINANNTTVTVPTTPNTAITNTSLLLNFTNAGVIDSTKNSDLTTVSTAQISTAQAKYGTSSIAFNGSTDYLSTSYPNPQISLGTGDFTVEGWVYSTSRSTPRGIFQLSATSGGLVANTSTGLALLTTATDGRLNIYAGGNTSGFNSTSTTVPLNTWTHFALVRSSGITKVYMNGTLVTDLFTAGSLTDTFNYTGSYIAIGGTYSTSNLWQGYIDNFSITKGKALYTTNFTPATINSYSTAAPEKIKINNPVTPPMTTAWVNNSTLNAYTISGTCSQAGTNNIKIFSDTTLLSTTSCAGDTFSTTVDLSAFTDGAVRLSAVFTDSNGNTYNSSTTTITKDTSAPSSVIVSWPLSRTTITALNQYAIYVMGSCSENGSGNVTLKAGTSTVGYPMSCINNTFSDTFDFSSVTDGIFFLTVVHSDSAGNTITSSPLSIAKDSIGPTLVSISIAGGATATNTTTVSLSLSASGTPTQMYITNTAGCASGGAWEDYATTKSTWTLAQTNATATVYVKYRDVAYNESACSGDTIIHDSVAPTAPSAVNDGSTSTATASPTLSWTASTDSSSGLSYYEVAIGTTAGATDFMTWTNVGSSTSTQITGQNFTQGSTYFASVRARDQAGNISAIGQGDGWTVLVDGCPTNYVRVPALAGYTSSSFCVAKYEAKIYGINTAISQASGTPWASITQTAAITACQANGTGYDLISNAEWQTVARNIEGVSSNWSSGIVGTGSINRGNSDDNPNNTLAADASDSNACSGTGQTCSNTLWDTQRRTHVLSNGQVVWDVAGNVWEWTKDTNTTNFGAWAYMSQVTTSSHTTTGTIGSITGVAKLLFGPSGNYTALSTGDYGGLGYGYLNSSGAVARGASWLNGLGSGVFAVFMGYASSYSGGDVGFRCVYHNTDTTNCSGSQVFTYTGSDQTFTVPTSTNCTISSISVKAWGAGGGGSSGAFGAQKGGGGGFTSGTLNVSSGTQLKVIVGGGGNTITDGGSEGGGRSAIQSQAGIELLTAAGGGGSGRTNFGAPGGGLTGSSGGGTSPYIGGGATQTTGGIAGQGEYCGCGPYNAESGSTRQGGGGGGQSVAGIYPYGGGGRGSYGCSGGGGGGGGYYGGGGGGSCGHGGGSGSSFVPTGGTTVAGSNENPGNTTDLDYTLGTGNGGNGTKGTSGRVVISWSAPITTPLTGIIQNGISRNWANGTYATSCNDYINPSTGYAYTGATGDGIYTINPGSAAINVYCDMTTDSGGWTLVARALSGSYAHQNTTEIGTLTSPLQTTVAKLSDSVINQIAKQYLRGQNDTGYVGAYFNATSQVFIANGSNLHYGSKQYLTDSNWSTCTNGYHHGPNSCDFGGGKGFVYGGRIEGFAGGCRLGMGIYPATWCGAGSNGSLWAK